MRFILFTAIFIFNITKPAYSQDSSKSLNATELLSPLFLKTIKNKSEVYSQQVENKTLNVLSKLAKWETRVQKILNRVSPETEKILFAPGIPTFQTMKDQFSSALEIKTKYSTVYDEYQDMISLQIKYIKNNDSISGDKSKKSIENIESNLLRLKETVSKSEITKKFIEERKKLLIQNLGHLLKNTKYLRNINRDSYYYIEALKNYKTTFDDPKKCEDLVLKILKSSSSFNSFCEKNSQLSGIFAGSSHFSNLISNPSGKVVLGLPTRANMEEYLQKNVPNINVAGLTKYIQQNMEPNGTASELKNVFGQLPKIDPKGLKFKKNSQKVKAFHQRLVYNFDLQFAKSSYQLPSTAQVGIGVGYKLDDKITSGAGINYYLGLGNGWQHINFTTESIGIRTFFNRNLKKGFSLHGGSEWNYNTTAIAENNAFKDFSKWEQSALLGFTKTISIAKKSNKEIQILYDFMARKKMGGGSPFVLRYNFKFQR